MCFDVSCAQKVYLSAMLTTGGTLPHAATILPSASFTSPVGMAGRSTLPCKRPLCGTCQWQVLLLSIGAPLLNCRFTIMPCCLAWTIPQVGFNLVRKVSVTKPCQAHRAHRGVSEKGDPQQNHGCSNAKSWSPMTGSLF